MIDKDETPELIRKMNAELLGDGDQPSQYQATKLQVSRLWELYGEARAQPSSAQRLTTRIDAGMQELIRRVRLDVLAATSTIGQGVSVSRAAASLEEAVRLIEQGDPSEIVAIALNIAADPANADALDNASTKLRKAGVANFNSNVLLIIVLVLITLGLSIGQAELPAKAQTVAADCTANLALALAISDHIKRNKRS